jgi:hypothetical protein
LAAVFCGKLDNFLCSHCVLLLLVVDKQLMLFSIARVLKF